MIRRPLLPSLYMARNILEPIKNYNNVRSHFEHLEDLEEQHLDLYS